MLESLRKQIQELEADIAGLEEKIRVKKAEKSTIAAQVQARIFLERIFAPYMDGVCQEWGVSPEEGLCILIKEDATLGKIAADNPEALAELASQPEIRAITAVARPLANVSDEWIKEKMTVLLEVMKNIRPSLANAIIETPGGQAWFYQSLVGLRNSLFGKPQLK
ncbi:unnamed protein product [marine sediment metagenome]|uniref:Uncharacterized protein n=1 Tax=marine sediment metagenome TaxID=412755 RepID=X1H470_9ZZZZ